MGEERRLLTVLFADLVGSTELGSETDPEVLRRQMTQYFERMKEIAQTHGGTVEKFIGDAVMVVFGAPRMHDDDAERAIRCGLAMQAGMASLNADLGLELALRVGVNTGEAVVRSGDDGQFIVGDPVNVAARLQQGAAAGEVVAGQLTAQLTSGAVEYRARPLALAKGKPLPLESFQAVGTRNASPGRMSRLPGLRATLVGREPELQQITECFARVRRQQHSQVLTLVGSPGVGKSRLIEEALNAISPTGCPVRHGRCLPYGRGITYWPMKEILRADAGITQDDDRATALDKLNSRLGTLNLAVERRSAVATRVAVLLGLSPADETLADVPAEHVAAEFGWALRQYVDSLAAEQPAVFVIDDLQWGEPALLDLIDRLVMRTAHAAVLWICVARPEFVESHPHWAPASNAVTVNLNPLSPADTSTLVSQLLDIDDIPGDLHRRLVERSEGNPLFCEEFLRMLIDDHYLVKVADRWRATKGVATLRIPESIQALLTARLDSLPEAEKQTLQAASIVGERFRQEQVAALCPGVDVTSALNRLRDRDLTLDVSGSPDAGGLRFKHLLIRDVTYATLSKTDRAELHDRFAAHLERRTGDRRSEISEIIAYHAAQAVTFSREMRLPIELTRARARRALHWSLLTGEGARSRNDWIALTERLAAAQMALEIVAPPNDDMERLRFRLLQADQMASTDDNEGAWSAASEVATLAARNQEWQMAAEGHLRLARIAVRSYRAGASAEAYAAEALKLFRRAGDAVGELEARWWTAMWSEMGTNPVEAVEQCRRIAEQAAELGEYPRAGSWMSVTANQAVAVGHPDARQLTRTAQELIERAGSRMPVMLIGALAGLDALSGELDRAVSRLRDAIAAKADESWDLIYAQRYLAVFLINAGRLAEADPILDEAIERSEQTGEAFNRTELLSRRSISAVRQGDVELGERYATQALEASPADDFSALGESRWALAELRAAQGRDAEAEHAYAEALGPLQQLPYSLLREEIELSYARYLTVRGRGHEALRLLDSIESWLQLAGYRYLLDEVSALRQEANSVGAR